MTEKNLLLLRALTVLNDVEGLKALLQGLMSNESPQAANAQGFTILAQYLMQKVRNQTSVLTRLYVFYRKSIKFSLIIAYSFWSQVQSK